MTDSRISRRLLLQLAAGAGLAPYLGPMTATASAADGPTILTDDVFPIGLFWPPPKSETTHERYVELAAAGINVVSGGNDVNKTDSAPLAETDANALMMQHAYGVGIRALPTDNRISHATTCGNWQDGIRRALAEYEAYPAFAGFRIADEPSPVEYPRYRMIADVLKAAAPQHLAHINLVPVYSASAQAAYEEHLRRYVEQVDPTFVSFDHYPLLTDGTVRSTYFLNWALVRAAGLAANRPTWVYIQSVDHWNIKRPNYAEIFWQITMSLAYGCKGIQYFTYWTPINREDFEFGAALIGKDLRPTQVYHDASRINREFLAPVGRELKHLVSESVEHANENPLPLGAKPFAADAVVQSVTGGSVVIGRFRQAVEDGQRWLLVANRSHQAQTTARVTVSREVAEFAPATGDYRPIAGAFDVRLAAGEARLYRLSGLS
ncbi:hypothetical protein OG394_14555 [Kribbella sp. NBC_01245]|uniref:hypothetical protein n=1 Tax=Kribbella sp. NBC_01245 TaxID=2903578 RepID=UPI002E2B381D|nr:hypothetical protein [Kribbella sp. NBC_01245]